MLLGGRGELPRQCWEKLLELCTSGLHVLRDCFKKLQLSHLNSGKGWTIHTDCAGEERQSLLMELISWYLFMGERMATAGAQAAHKAHGHTRGPRCRRAELQREGPVPGGNRLGQKATLVHQSQPGFLHGCPKHTKTTVFSPTHMKAYCERLGCREGRRRGSYCSFHSCTVPKGSLQGHGAWGQTRQFCQCGPQPQRKMLFSIKIHN